MSYYLGVDAGATNLRVGIVQDNGKLLDVSVVPSPLVVNPHSFASLVRQEANKFVRSLGMEMKDIKAVGVGIPGPLDLEKGLILPSANLHNQVSINLAGQFEAEFNIPTYFDRDANVALLGEAWQGGAVGIQDAVMLTVGTGVGGAVMVDGKVEQGVSGKAGEIGHMILEIDNGGRKMDKMLTCGLGHEGCLEALINSTNNLEEVGTYLGYALANIVNIFNPRVILIGGGKVKMGDFLSKAVLVMKRAGMHPAVDEVEVSYAKLEELSGVYGGAKLAMNHYDTNPNQS